MTGITSNQIIRARQRWISETVQDTVEVEY